MTEMIDIVSSIKPAADILDVGIGYGFLDTVLRLEHGRNIIGMELPENIPVYCDMPRLAGIPILARALGAGNIDSGSFDLVIFGEVFEHLRISPMRALTDLQRSLRPGGYLLLTTPNIARLNNIGKLILGRNILEKFRDDDTGLEHIIDSLTHIQEFSMGEVRELLEAVGFVVEVRRHSWSWDCYNQYYWSFRQSGRAARAHALIHAALTKLMPIYRHEMIFLARKV